MSDNYCIPFIKQEDFENHVAQTIKTYNATLKSIDLAKFNSNIIDPIKLTFDKALFRKSIEDIIELEIHRQRDKSNTNAIGYFHQYMFKYIANCEVPQHGLKRRVEIGVRDGRCHLADRDISELTDDALLHSEGADIVGQPRRVPGIHICPQL